MSTKYELSPKTAAEELCKIFPDDASKINSRGNCLGYTNSVLEDILDTDDCLAMLTGVINYGVWRSVMLSKLIEETRVKDREAGKYTDVDTPLNDVGYELIHLIKARLESQHYNCQWPGGRK